MKRILALGTLTLAALGTVTAASADSMGSSAHQQRTAGAYRITLQIGPAEAMSMHPKGSTGERMLGGKMASCSMAEHSMGGMSMGSGACNRHIEIHVANRHTGKVVINARVAIRLTDQHMHTVITVPIMTMVGANHGMSDLHYGNNIHAAAGHYTVSVRVNGTAASFSVNVQ